MERIKPSPKVGDAIAEGHTTRVLKKSRARKPVHRPPRLAGSRHVRLDFRLSKRHLRAYERCLRRHRVTTTYRFQEIGQPTNRRLIYLWRNYQDVLPAHTIERIKNMLGAQVPYGPDQAHTWFAAAVRKRKEKRNSKKKKKGIAALCVSDTRYSWIRNMMVALARGIKQRLCKSGEYTLADGMQRLSQIILQDMCGYIRRKPPCRHDKNRKAQFMTQIADKVAVWINEILLESDTRMLMMDYDEDDDVAYDGFADDFLTMMAGGKGETDEQRMTRLVAEKLLGRPETPEERKRRLEIEKRLGRPETPEELRARMSAEKKLGRPETEEELRARVGGRKSQGGAGESNEQRNARLQAEQILGRPETPEERSRRLEVEKRLGRPETPEELRARMAAEKQLGRPETEEEIKKRTAAEQDLKKYEPGTDTQKQARHAAETILGRPETEAERQTRLEIEKRLGRPETPEELRARLGGRKSQGGAGETNEQRQARLEAEKILGRPETPDERSRRLEVEKRLGRPETPEELRARLSGRKSQGGAGETNEQRQARLEAEKILGRPETPEERSRRLEVEKRLGRPETPEELRARMAVEKQLGRPETEEEIKKRTAEQDLKKYEAGTDTQKQARHAAETILGRPETEAERQTRLEIEKRLGRPETPEELRARLGERKSQGGAGETNEQRQTRLEAEKILGRPETPEERNRRLEVEKRLGRPETPEEFRARMAAEKQLGRPETEEEIKKRTTAEQDLKKYEPGADTQTQARHAAETILGRPETEAERQTRLEIEKRLGRPETPEELRARLGGRKSQGGAGETNEQRQARLEAEKILGRPETPEERSRRLEVEKRLGRPETPEELRARMAVEKQLGRPETEEEFKKRMAEQDLTKYGPETDAQKKARLETEKILGRPETDAERRRRLEIEQRLGRPETPQEIRARMEAEKMLGRPETQEEFRERLKNMARSGTDDPDKEAATRFLHQELKAKGNEIFHETSKTKLSHSTASDWLKKAPVRVDRFVMESGEAEKTTQKFEKKLGSVMANTPPAMQDVMQDVIIESARNLGELFVAKNYRLLVGEALISELQKRGSSILIEVDGVVETTFAAAQRLKLASSLQVSEPNVKLSYALAQNLNDIVKNCCMSRRLIASMKDHVKNEVADYLSVHVTKPEPFIDAYVALLREMEAAGDRLLVEDSIAKSFKDAAAYLRQLTTFKDQINRPNSKLQATIEKNFIDLMSRVPPSGYSDSDMRRVITENAKLLTSYIMLQDEKTKALQVLIGEMDKQEDNVLLRHGTVRKTYVDGADTLRDKNAEQLVVTGVDAVAARKIQIKLKHLMSGQTPNEFKDVMSEVIEDAVSHMAVALLQPHSIKVCKCMNSVYVQCELWCEEMLHSVTQSQCSCSRQDEAAQIRSLMASLVPSDTPLHIYPRQRQASATGLTIQVKQCPATTRPVPSGSCLAIHPCPGLHSLTPRPPPANPKCSANYMVHTTTIDRERFPSRLNPFKNVFSEASTSQPSTSSSRMTFMSDASLAPGKLYIDSDSIPTLEPKASSNNAINQNQSTKATAMPTVNEEVCDTNESSYSIQSQSLLSTVSTKTTHMFDWHSMLVSFIWNVQGLCTWMQETIDQVLSPASVCVERDWDSFQRKVITEALQYLQCKMFLQKLENQIARRYRDKQMLSAVCSTSQTAQYLKCQRDTLEIVEVFSMWVKWLVSIIKQIDTTVKHPDASQIELNLLRWDQFKAKVEKITDAWAESRRQLQRFFEKYKSFLSEWQQSEGAWVVSADGAVPSGAVVAGVDHGETIFLARTTHGGKVYPAAVIPSQHCCVVYSEGRTYLCTKYQVMCNASVKWVSAEVKGVRAVRVADGVFVGRVHFWGSHVVGAVRAPELRCHVVILGRPFAFKCYDLLVHAEDAVSNDFTESDA